MLLRCTTCSVLLASMAGAAEPLPGHWSGLPFYEEIATSRGVELPPPLGFGLLVSRVSRDIAIDSIRLSAPGQPGVVVSDFADFSADSEVDVVLARIDAWVLPFLDVYLLGGTLDNRSNISMDISTGDLFPGLPGNQALSGSTTVAAQVDGFIGGFGVTAAGGIDDWFATIDVNWTQSEMGFDDTFMAIIGTARLGWQGAAHGLPLRFYGGAAYWDSATTATATVSLGGQQIRYEVDQRPVHPANAVVGATWSPWRHLELIAEYGFNLDDVEILTAGFTGRF